MLCRLVLAGSLLVAGSAGTAAAEMPEEAYIVTRSGPGEAQIPLRDPLRKRVYVVSRPVVEPAAVVSEALSQQPVHPHLVELVVVNTPVTIDPDYRFLAEEPGSLDEDHYLIEAQRLGKARRASPARVIRRPDAAPAAAPGAAEIQPRAILLKPEFMRDGDGADQQPEAMPSVPAPPEQADLPRKIARVE